MCIPHVQYVEFANIQCLKCVVHVYRVYKSGISLAEHYYLTKCQLPFFPHIQVFPFLMIFLPGHKRSALNMPLLQSENQVQMWMVVHAILCAKQRIILVSQGQPLATIWRVCNILQERFLLYYVYARGNESSWGTCSRTASHCSTGGSLGEMDWNSGPS